MKAAIVVLALMPVGKGMPDPQLQQRINEAIDVLSREGRFPARDAAKPLIVLEAAARDTESHVARELLHAYAIASKQADGDGRTLKVLKLLEVLEIPRSAVAEAVIPYLDADDKAMQGAVEEFMDFVEGRCDEPDYSYYLNLMQAARDRPLRSLIRYMIVQTPGRALVMLVRQQRVVSPERRARWDDLLLSEHVISSAIWKLKGGFEATDDVRTAREELAKLVEQEEWWIRLYVVEVLRYQKELRAHGMIERLKTDPDEVVRQAAEAIGK
ncbi:MAG: hypothetical protein WD847_14900 [Pirellulales bacterium]